MTGSWWPAISMPITKRSGALRRLWREPTAWWRTSLLNTANMGWFSSDRAIREYAGELWVCANRGRRMSLAGRRAAPQDTGWQAHPAEIAALLEARHADPFAFLGPHETASAGVVIRAFVPHAETLQAVPHGGGAAVDADPAARCRVF